MTQFYVGVKIVTAWEEERDGKPGYAVKYEDGYISWSPREAFEHAYLPMGHDASKVNEEMIAAMMDPNVETQKVDDRTVLLKARTRSDFRFYETASYIDPATFDQEVGQGIAAVRVASRMWELLGFVVAWGKNGLAR